MNFEAEQSMNREFHVDNGAVSIINVVFAIRPKS